MPLCQTYLLTEVSRRTSVVFISLPTNFLISRTARGARFLKPLHTARGVRECTVGTSCTLLLAATISAVL